MRATVFSRTSLTLLAFLSLLFGIIACGGSGGGGGGLTNIRLVVSQGGIPIDLATLIAGDVVTLQVVGTNSTGGTETIAANFTTNAPGSIAVVSGTTLSAIASSGGITYLVTASGGGTTLSANLSVAPATSAIVNGRVRASTGTGIANVRVSFYTSTGTLLGTYNTGATGTFRAPVPLSAAKFTIDLSVADPGTGASGTIWYRQFAYGPKTFLTGASNCLAPLPALVLGNNNLPNDIVPPARADGPAPPPNGCLG